MLRTSVLCLIAGLVALQPSDPPRKPLVESKPVTLHASDLPLSKALAELRRQTGILVTDERGDKDSAITLDLDRVSFWQALDAIAVATKARVVLGRDGGISIARRSPGDRVPPTCYDGDFRLRVVRVAASRELDSDRSSCQFTVEVVWTPTLRPLFIDSQAHGVRILDSKSKPILLVEEGGTLAPVDGRVSFAFDVTAPGLPRRETHVALVEGKLNAVVPTKFLTFRFDADLVGLKDAVAGGAVRRLVQEDVVCRVERIVLEKERWSVRMGLEYPTGGKTLESFQASSLVVNNDLRLVSADGKRSLPASSYVIDSVSSRRAQVTYHFTDRPGARRGSAQNWKVQYSAPARIVEVPVTFRFRDVPLP